MSLISVTIQSDDKGFFDRECPNEICHYQFKIKLKDWKEKVSDKQVFCPMCGYKTTSNKWNTVNQLEQIRDIAVSHEMSSIQKELYQVGKKLENSTRRNNFIKIKYKQGMKIIVNNGPIVQGPSWEQEIICEKCGTTYSVVGSAYFCPCCGHNSASSSFLESLDIIQKRMDSLDEVKIIYMQLYGADKTETICRKDVEESLGHCVSAFQKFASSQYTEISGKQSHPNDFQIIDKGSKMFSDFLGFGYEQWVSIDEINKMKIYFQKRHIIEHNDGIVDVRYLSKVADMSYDKGQRLIIRKDDIYDLLKILRKIGEGLISIN